MALKTEQFANEIGAVATLASAITSGDLACAVSSALNFSVLSPNQQFKAMIQDTPTSAIEIIKVTATSGVDFIIERGQEGTAAAAHVAGAAIAQVITKGIIQVLWPTGNVIIVNGDISIDGADGHTAVNQAAPTAININLPANAVPWKHYPISDFGQNFSANPATIVPPGGGNILGDANWPMDIQNMYLEFFTPDGVNWGIAG